MELVPAARETLRNTCERRTGCGGCRPCRTVLAVAKRRDPQLAPSEAAEGATERPSVRAPKATWVAYAVSVGMDRTTAEGWNKAHLIEVTG